MSKGLEVLNHLYLVDTFDEGKLKEYYNIVEKELKALEIIKKKRVDCWYLRYVIAKYDNLEVYNNYADAISIEQYDCICNRLSQEEYSILKEVLCDDNTTD